MFCSRCQVHFSGLATCQSCPYCGGKAEITPAVELEKPVVMGVVNASGSEVQRTRTESPLVGAGNVVEDRWRPGTVVAGKYEVLETLGSGGFGTVYKVRHLVRKKHYALKTPHFELARSEAFRRRFEREIEAMERFTHPDAVTIRDSGITEDLRPYYTMDFIDGESLKTVLARENRLPPARAVAIVVRVLKVLDVAHAHRIVHRDIKPDNILLVHTGGREAVKVLDFGVAKLLDLVHDSGSTSQSLRIGTPKYMSPEQILGDPVGILSDVFSTGIVLYEMIVGCHPFAQGNDLIRTTAAILHREPPSPRELVPEVDRSLSDLILMMLEKNPRRRPSSVAAVFKELQEVPVASTREEICEPVALIRAARRSPAVPMVLRYATDAGERRMFLYFAERLQFGRGNRSDQGIVNAWIWRCLPCRSSAQDPEAWQKNLTISHRAGWVTIDGTVVTFESAPDSKHGITVAGVRSQRTARIHADRFHVALGDRALELDGCRVSRSPRENCHDLGVLERERPAGIEAPHLFGYSNRSARVDSVSFYRASNWPLHEYHWVPRCLRLGSSANVPLRFRAEGVEAVHASIILEGGEAFLLAIAGGIRARGVASGGGHDLGEIDLPPGTLLPLAPGIEIMIARLTLRVDVAEESLFKTV